MFAVSYAAIYWRVLVPRCEQRRVTLDMLQEADEVFICNTVKGIVPVTAIDDLEFDIGPVTRELQDWLMEGARKT